MSFQSTVNVLLNLGVPGDFAFDEPNRVQPVTLDSNGGAIASFFTKNAATGIGTQGGVISQGTSSFTASTTSGSPTLNVTAMANGSQAIQVGQTVTGTGIPASTTIIAYVTGAGGVGTYTMSANATATASGVSVAGSGGTPTVLGGIAVNPKQEPQFGSSATNPLAPNLTLQPNSTVAMMTLGSCIVNLPNAFNVGDQVIYNVSTGALASMAPNGSLPAGYAVVPDCVVLGGPSEAGVMGGESSAGLAIIRITTPN